MSQIIRLGISTCPNDTFAFAALINQCIDWRGLEFETEFMDIRDLNTRLVAGDFDVAKASFHAALTLTESTVVLPSGSALGFGVGPLLLAAVPNSTISPESRVLCPGELTTATMLLKLFHESACNIEHVVFSEIMPRLREATADFGVCIHEGRFTWRESGLHCVEDLGVRWEQACELPLPLGGILADRGLGDKTLAKVQAVVRDSVQFALNDPESAKPMMREHAQEFDDDVLMKHVGLYVNDWTVDLGSVGRAALVALSRRAQEAGLIRADAKPIEVFEG